MSSRQELPRYAVKHVLLALARWSSRAHCVRSGLWLQDGLKHLESMGKCLRAFATCRLMSGRLPISMVWGVDWVRPARGKPRGEKRGSKAPDGGGVGGRGTLASPVKVWISTRAALMPCRCDFTCRSSGAQMRPLYAVSSSSATVSCIESGPASQDLLTTMSAAAEQLVCFCHAARDTRVIAGRRGSPS